MRFLTYNETMQTSCLRLMGKKLLVSLAMEGKFSNEGLQGIEDDDDVLTAMARELVTQRGVGESASAVWKAVQEQHARLLPASSVLDEELREELVAGPFNEVVAFDGTLRPWFLGCGSKRSRLDEGLSSSNRTVSSRCSEIEPEHNRTARLHFRWASVQQRRRIPWNCFLWN